MRKRSPIKLRNALTELWNDGQSVSTIAHECGMPVDKVNEYLAVAREGFNTPREKEAWLIAQAEKKEVQAAERAAAKESRGKKRGKK